MDTWKSLTEVRGGEGEGEWMEIVKTVTKEHRYISTEWRRPGEGGGGWVKVSKGGESGGPL